MTSAPRSTGPSEVLGRVELRPGEVVLVGAGPGDRDLLTLRAVAYLRSAEVIYYDRGLDHVALQWAPRGARRIPVSPPGPSLVRSPPLPWERDLLARARAGARVVRWMRGDPFSTGEGFRTLARLTTAGVATSVVPGLSPILAGPTLASLPLLLEGTSESFTVLRGPLARRARRTARARPRYFGPTDTVVSWIEDRDLRPALLALQRVVPRTTNAALIGDAGTDGGWVLRASLRLLTLEVRRRDLHGPVLLVAGRVAAGDLLPPPAHRWPEPSRSGRTGGGPRRKPT